MMDIEKNDETYIEQKRCEKRVLGQIGLWRIMPQEGINRIHLVLPGHHKVWQGYKAAP